MSIFGAFINKNKKIKYKNSSKKKTKKIGDEGLEVQIDEVAICNSFIVKNPSFTLDDKKMYNGLLAELIVLKVKIFFKL
ncbi:hypothetical protein H311_03505 [Anncaliia algerae PRA109]|nr:hypothetical protein H311_03505 [Anncaliia algerae PRA109]